jgi:LuxR family maltose regulon positive regulatory protein
MTTPLLTTKLYLPPPRPDLVPRPRLVELLDTGLQHNRKLTLVSAPAGYGKTTLVSTWVQGTERPYAWLSLDEKDNDWVRFLTYIITALGQIEVGLGNEVQEALVSSQSPQTDILLTMLVNEISSYAGEFTLVLDDIHLISDHSIYEAIDFLLNYLPKGMHLVIIGRVDPLISLSRLRVGGQLTEIRSDQLRFNKAETAAFLNEMMNLELSHQEISALESRTEGWIAGLQLAALSLQDREDKQEFITAFSGIHHHILDYLIEEVLSRQPAGIRSFLCRASILERLSAPLCDATLGISDSQTILRKIEAANLFLIPLDEEKHWYRFHHLFADFLQLCLQEEKNEVITELHHRAARWYELNGFVPEALNHLLAVGDNQSAAQLAEINARGMLARSELASLMKMIEKIPQEHVRNRPRLWIYQTWALRLSGSPYDVVESRLDLAEHAVRDIDWSLWRPEVGSRYNSSEDEVRNLWAHIYALRAFQAVYREDFDQVFVMAEKANDHAPDEKFVKGGLSFALGWAYRFSGDLETAYQAFTETSTLSQASGNIYMAASTLSRAAYGLVLAGKLNQAAQVFQDALNLTISEDGKQYPVAGYAYVYLSGIYYEWNDLEIARRYAIEGIKLCERVGLIMDQAVGYVNLARVHVAEGNLESAQEACQSARELSQLMKDYVYTRRWVEDCRVRLWIAQENNEALLSWVENTDLKIDDPPNFKRDIDQLILARALVALGSRYPSSTYIEDALILLTRLRELAETGGWYGKAVEIIVLQAMALHAVEKYAEAIITLENALSLAEIEGYLRTFIDEGAPMLNLLTKVAEHVTPQDFVNKLIKSFNAAESTEPIPAPQKLVEPLSAREMDVLRMLSTDFSGPEIAEEMHIALTTLRFHTRNIYSKLSVNNRRTAVRRAESLDLI